MSQLEEYLPDLQKRRGSDVLANDFYEALDDWSCLGRHVLERDTRVNYPIRARNELALWVKLQSLARSKPPEEQQQYMPMLEVAQELLKQIEAPGGSQDSS
jgi:hypothetical protein